MQQTTGNSDSSLQKSVLQNMSPQLNLTQLQSQLMISEDSAPDVMY